MREESYHGSPTPSDSRRYTARHHKAARYIQARVRGSIDRKAAARKKSISSEQKQKFDDKAAPGYRSQQIERNNASGPAGSSRDKRRHDRKPAKYQHDDPQLNQAATTIQAIFRGNRDRDFAGEQKRRSKRLKNPMLWGRKQMPGTAQLRDARFDPPSFCGAGRVGTQSGMSLRDGRLMLAPQAADWRSQNVIASRSRIPQYLVSANPRGRGPMVGVQRSQKPAPPEKFVRTNAAGAGAGSISALQDLSLSDAVDRIASVGREWRARHQDSIDAKQDPFRGIYSDVAPYGFGPNGVISQKARASSPTASLFSNTSGSQMRPPRKNNSLVLDPVSSHLGFAHKAGAGHSSQVPTDVYAWSAKQNRTESGYFDESGLLGVSARVRAEALESAKNRLGAR